MGYYSNNPDNFRRSTRNASSSSRTYDIEVQGFYETNIKLGALMTSDPSFAQNFKKLLRMVLSEARNKLSRDVKAYMQSDPRRASRAVKYALYKRIFGGNISILGKRGGTAGRESTYEPPRKLREGQRGGNRIKRVLGRSKTEKYERNRLAKYYGADRGFVLRFINAGTSPRTSRYGNRGSIGATGWFGKMAPWHMDTAAAEVADAITEYINNISNK